ncbi:MAG: phosphate signaling complex protein PhoU [Bacilli bacterium]|jgi:phosphate transport system protein|nr:phosphate signaling complex protein PhoU [Bacilli bacterium]
MIILDEVMNEILLKVVLMFDLTIINHNKAIEALISGDHHLALEVIESDEKINQLEQQINYDVMLAIAKHQPVARDLRYLIAMIKVANDVERIGDYAKSNAKTAIINSDRTFLTTIFLKNMKRMGDIIARLLEDSKQAFLNVDVDKAYSLVREDNSLVKILNETLENNPFEEIKDNNVESFVSINGVIRTLERTRGHLANICEATIFVGNGEFVEL